MKLIEKLGITPGPWTSRRGCIAGIFDGGMAMYDGWYNEPDEADLRLMTAAPEMLEALIELTNIHPANITGMISWWDKAYEIIEKATGKTWAEIKELIK